jgi:predicted phosphodiesterase
MRVAIVSDIHGNRTAFEAVLADLEQTSPDVIFHGGDLAHGGSSPAEIVDRVRDLGWPGVLGNTDELLFKPESLTDLPGNRQSCNRFSRPSRRWQLRSVRRSEQNAWRG